MESPKRFNVRVYGLLIHDKKVLVSDEQIQGHCMTKFPGGGLEFGEGTIECVIREFIEETGNRVEVVSHFYTTDFFVQSAFSKESQVISIYYLVKPAGELHVKTSDKKFGFDVNNKADQQSLRWVYLSDISEDDFTFVIDKKVASLIRNYK